MVQLPVAGTRHLATPTRGHHQMPPVAGQVRQTQARQVPPGVQQAAAQLPVQTDALYLPLEPLRR
jgi:hypothetical protein